MGRAMSRLLSEDNVRAPVAMDFVESGFYFGGIEDPVTSANR